MPDKETPFFIVPANEPFLRQFDELFARFATENKHTLVLDVDPELVDTEDVAFLQQIVMALQHQPQLIEKMVFSLDIKFTQIKDSKLYFPETHWKADAKYYKWFYAMASSPVMMFFLQDEDARFYTLIGDMLAKNILEIRPGDRKGKQMVGFSGEELKAVVERLFNSCFWMLIFCHGSGFNPQPYIEGVLADLDLPVTYQDVYNAFDEQLEKGIHLRALPRE